MNLDRILDKTNQMLSDVRTEITELEKITARNDEQDERLTFLQSQKEKLEEVKKTIEEYKKEVKKVDDKDRTKLVKETKEKVKKKMQEIRKPNQGKIIDSIFGGIHNRLYAYDPEKYKDDEEKDKKYKEKVDNRWEKHKAKVEKRYGELGLFSYFVPRALIAAALFAGVAIAPSIPIFIATSVFAGHTLIKTGITLFNKRRYGGPKLEQKKKWFGKKSSPKSSADDFDKILNDYCNELSDFATKHPDANNLSKKDIEELTPILSKMSSISSIPSFEEKLKAKNLYDVYNNYKKAWESYNKKDGLEKEKRKKFEENKEKMLKFNTPKIAIADIPQESIDVMKEIRDSISGFESELKDDEKNKYEKFCNVIKEWEKIQANKKDMSSILDEIAYLPKERADWIKKTIIGFKNSGRKVTYDQIRELIDRQMYEYNMEKEFHEHNLKKYKKLLASFMRMYSPEKLDDETLKIYRDALSEMKDYYDEFDDNEKKNYDFINKVANTDYAFEGQNIDVILSYWDFNNLNTDEKLFLVALLNSSYSAYISKETIQKIRKSCSEYDIYFNLDDVVNKINVEKLESSLRNDDFITNFWSIDEDFLKTNIPVIKNIQLIAEKYLTLDLPSHSAIPSTISAKNQDKYLRIVGLGKDILDAYDTYLDKPGRKK